MQATIWTLATCIPNESDPVIPLVFTCEAAALAEFDRVMRDEWMSNAPVDDDSGEALDYPEGDPQAAHDKMAEKNVEAAGDDLWGEWTLTPHVIDLPAIDVPVVPATVREDLVKVARTAINACDILAEECEQDGEVIARDSWRGNAARARAAVQAHTQPMLPPATRSPDILARIRAM